MGGAVQPTLSPEEVLNEAYQQAFIRLEEMFYSSTNVIQIFYEHCKDFHKGGSSLSQELTQLLYVLTQIRS